MISGARSIQGLRGPFSPEFCATTDGRHAADLPFLAAERLPAAQQFILADRFDIGPRAAGLGDGSAELGGDMGHASIHRFFDPRIGGASTTWPALRIWNKTAALRAL